MSFQIDGYKVVQNILDSKRREFFSQSFMMSGQMGQLKMDGDLQVPGSPSAYKHDVVEKLLRFLLPSIETATDLSLHPTYSYSRIYQKGAVLKKHTDREACEVSVTVNLGGDNATKWPIYLETSQGTTPVHLEPGDGLVYRGIDLPHWREEFMGDHQVQAFLHYVDQNGPHAHLKFDANRSVA